jgi:hypothetical protein
MPDPNEEPPSVGYGHPPQASQFKSGQSGNPAGRPKKPNDLNARVSEQLNLCIPALIDGVETLLTQKQAAVRAIIRKAFAGDARALAMLLQQWQASHPTKSRQRTICQFGKKGWYEGDGEMREGIFNPEVD